MITDKPLPLTVIVGSRLDSRDDFEVGSQLEEGFGKYSTMAWLAESQGVSLNRLNKVIKDRKIGIRNSFLSAILDMVERSNPKKLAISFLIHREIEQAVNMANWYHQRYHIKSGTTCCIADFESGEPLAQFKLEKGVEVQKDMVYAIDHGYIGNEGRYSIKDMFGLSYSAFNG